MKTCSKCGKEKPVEEFYSKRGWCCTCEVKRIMAWRKRNPEKTAAQKKKYSESHRDKMCATVKRWSRRNLVKRAATQANREARKRASVIGNDEKAIRGIYLLARTARRLACYICSRITRRGERHVEHVVPLSKGGCHTSGNLAIACVDCNLSKHAKNPAEVGLLL